MPEWPILVHGMMCPDLYLLEVVTRRHKYARNYVMSEHDFEVLPAHFPDDDGNHRR